MYPVNHNPFSNRFYSSVILFSIIFTIVHLFSFGSVFTLKKAIGASPKRWFLIKILEDPETG